MNRTMATVCALAIMSGSLLAWQSAPPSSSAPTAPVVHKKSASARTAAHKKAPKAQAAKLLPAQEMPPIPATLMNSTPVKPSVTMEGGLLTIDAPNSTLSDVLSGVHRATGASIEGVTPTERVVVKLGPGDPGQVLAALLHGTPYDYVILGATGKPDALTRIMLTPQSAQGSSNSGSTPPAEAMQSPNGGVGHPPRMLSPRQPENGDASMPDRPAADDVNAPENDEDQASQPTPAPPQTTQPDQQQTPAQPDANSPKTPEQLFKELQQLNQQRPQQQQTPQ